MYERFRDPADFVGGPNLLDTFGIGILAQAQDIAGVSRDLERKVGGFRSLVIFLSSLTRYKNNPNKITTTTATTT